MNPTASDSHLHYVSTLFLYSDSPNRIRKKLSPDAKKERNLRLTRRHEQLYQKQKEEREKKKKKKKRYRKRRKKQDKLNPPTWEDIYAKAKETVLAKRLTMLEHS